MNNVVETALDVMVEMGAELVDPVTIPDLEEQIGATTVYSYYGTLYLNEFLAQREAIPYDSVTEICEAGAYHKRLELLESIAEMTDDPEEVLDFWRSSLGQESFRRDVLNTFAADDLDAIVFPDVQVIPPTMSDLSDRYTTANFPTNTPIGAQTQCPAISIPGGSPMMVFRSVLNYSASHIKSIVSSRWLTLMSRQRIHASYLKRHRHWRQSNDYVS